MSRMFKSELLLKAKTFQVEQLEVQLKTGRIVVREIVRHPGAVIIAARDKSNNFLLINQFRWAIGQSLLEFPAGTREAGEDPLDTAKRELKEETGFSAKKWVFLGTIFPAPGFCDERQWCYLAEDLSPDVGMGDEDEDIEVVTLSEKTIYSYIADGTLIDAKSIALFTLIQAKGMVLTAKQDN